MLVERINNEVVIKMNSDIFELKEFQQLMNYLRYIEIAAKSKAKKSDLNALVNYIKKKRKV